jgi:hypothetical protein
MKTDKNGCSTCLAGQEQWETFDHWSSKTRSIETLYAYEYRSPISGNLLAIVARSLEDARAKRDVFMEKEKEAESEAERLFNANHPELNP